MAKANPRIGVICVVSVALTSVSMTWAQSDEVPRGLRERISRTLVAEGTPSAAGEFETERKITASDGASDDHFGISVAISGDTAIVGAWRGGENGTDSGSAYVYQRNEGGLDHWGQVTEITPSDGAALGLFGWSVAISGDIAIVGAQLDNPNGELSGSAYIYRRDEGGVDHWGEVTKIIASDGEASDLYGFSVAISGDTAIVGAPADDEPDFQSGSAYIYRRDNDGLDAWGEVTKITASDGGLRDRFGISVAISGDTSIVGAYHDNDKGEESGSAYVYRRGEGGIDNWGEVTKFIASEGAAYDHFGRSVAISGETVVVGVSEDDDLGEDSGSAYVYHRDEGGEDNWGEVAKITASDGTEDGWFGYSVAMRGDTAIVGALNDDDNGPGSGSAYVVRRDKGGVNNWGEVTKITASDGAAGDQFGRSVAISGDTAIVGAVLDDDNGEDSGSAYVYWSTVECTFDGDGDGDIDLIDFGMFQAAFTGGGGGGGSARGDHR